MFTIPKVLRGQAIRPATAAARWPLCILLRDYTVLPMPALSPTMTVGRISSWKKKDGETYKVDDVLCEVETDKAVVDFSAVDDGVLAKILIPAGGDPIPVGTALAIIVDDAADIPKALEEYAQKASSQPQVEQKTLEPAKEASVKTEKLETRKAKTSSEQSTPKKEADVKPTGKVVPVSPSARSILGEKIDFGKIQGTGRNGRIMKEDAIAYLSKKQNEPEADTSSKKSSLSSSRSRGDQHIPVAPPREARPQGQSFWLSEERGSFRDVPLTMMRRTIAQRLSENKEKVPHAYATIDADIESALEARSSLKKLGMPVPSMNDLVIRACALALVEVPNLNIRIEKDIIKPNDKVDISVAVATPGGLITPIIENADQKTPVEISSKMKDLAARAKENKLKPAEYQGGSFTVSNLGMLGIDDFTAIINPPQVAILAVGSGKRSLVVPPSTKKNEIGLDGLTSRTRMTVALSFDSRAVSPIHAAKFLQSFQAYMESPTALFVSGSATKKKASA